MTGQEGQKQKRKRTRNTQREREGAEASGHIGELRRKSGNVGKEDEGMERERNG